MQKPILGCDFDDVIMDFNGAFIPYHNLRFGTTVRYEDHTTYSLDQMYGSSPDTMIKRVHDFCDSLDHLEAKPVNGAIFGLQILASYYSIHVVTSRSETTRKVVESWIRKNIPAGVITKIHFTNSFGHHPTLPKKSKSEVCVGLGTIGLIDDAEEHAITVAAHGIPVALPDRPWNRSLKKKNVTRTFSWDETAAWAINPWR